MKNKELYAFKTGMDSILDIEACVKFNHVLAGNYRKVNQLIMDLDGSIKASDEWEEVRKKQYETNKRFSMKDDHGKPLVDERSNFIFDTEKEKNRTKALDKIKKDNKDLFDKREVAMKEYKALLEEEADFTPLTIDQQYVPDMKTRSAINIDYMIRDEEE